MGSGPASPAPAPPWQRSLGSTAHAQIAPLPDGGVLLVTVQKLLATEDHEVTVRAFDAQGEERWSQSILGGSSASSSWSRMDCRDLDYSACI